MDKKILKEKIQKAKEIVQEMNLEEPFLSLTYNKILENFLREQEISIIEESAGKYDYTEKFPSGIQGRILELKRDKIFDEPKSVSDIQKLLGERGFIYNTTDIAVALLRLVRKGFLRRVRQTQEGKEFFIYVNP